MASSYIWSNGAHSQSITTDSAGIYTVQTINGIGCTSVVSLPVTVVVNPLPASPIITRLGIRNDSLQATSAGATWFRWYKNGTLLPDSNAKIGISGQLGNYEVKAVSREGCVGSASQTLTVLGLEITLRKPQITISPNPFSDEFYVSSESVWPANSKIMVYDALGRLVNQTLMPENGKALPVNLANQPSGWYVLKIVSEARIGQWKVVKN